jgi:hypothetical protein
MVTVVSNPWTPEEIGFLNLSFPEFHAMFPGRSYDAYEVKRRRIAGGSAGTKPNRKHELSPDCWCGPRVLHIEYIHGK